MSKIIAYRSPRVREDATAWLGMVIFLGSWAMMFAALFFSYGMVRAHAEVWPPPGSVPLPIRLGALNTVVLGLSSGALQLALVQARRGKPAAVTPALGASLIGGLVFLQLQVRSWAGIYAAGMKPSDGPFPSVFYGLTGLHGLHVVVGLGGLVYLLVGALRGRHIPSRLVPLRLWTMYWHFVGVMWLLMFVTIYAL